MIKGQISNIWLKASVVGCLWASSEILLGSFLHNFHIPFASSFLTAIGIILLVSVSHLWKDKGLFWRSGLICALMKSVSPSAIILGPMIAIFCESLLMEMAVVVFQRNLFGYIMGGMLAMTWTFFHKIAAFILIYGFNMVTLYKDLALFAQKQLNIHFRNLWIPVFILWAVYLVMGILASITGVSVGRKAVKDPLPVQGINTNRGYDMQSPKPGTKFPTSLLWLGFNILAMISVLFLMNITGWIWWGSMGTLIIIIWTLRYKSALKPLKKPRFWIWFFLITMLTSFLFTKYQTLQDGIYQGLLIGVQMNLRAAVMIIGFSIIGTELCNPRIRDLFNRTSFRQLPIALEVSFETLPFVIANFPDFKNIFKRPVSVMHQLVSQADNWLERVSLRINKKDNVIIITGKIGQGKSTVVKNIADFFYQNHIVAGGIIALSVIENNCHTGYDLINISTKERVVLARTSGKESRIKVGKYYFYEEGIEFGENALSVDNNRQSQIIIIDEIGNWELENQGWSSCLNAILDNFKIPLILVVRNTLIERVIEKWSFENPLILDIAEWNIKDMMEKILDFITLSAKRRLS